MESDRCRAGHRQRDKTETLGHLLIVLGIIITAIWPLFWTFAMYDHAGGDFLFSDIMVVLQYLQYFGPVIFMLGVVQVVRIGTRGFHTRTRTSLPVYGGAMLILGGVCALVGHPLLLLVETLRGGGVGLDPLWVVLELAIIVVALFAGVLALKRRQWSLVLIACSTTLIISSILGLLALVPIALSRSEFAQE